MGILSCCIGKISSFENSCSIHTLIFGTLNYGDFGPLWGTHSCHCGLFFTDPNFYSYLPQHFVKFRLSPASLKKNMAEHRRRFGKRKRLEIGMIMRILGSDMILTILLLVSEIMSSEEYKNSWLHFQICPGHRTSSFFLPKNRYFIPIFI